MISSINGYIHPFKELLLVKIIMMNLLCFKYICFYISAFLYMELLLLFRFSIFSECWSEKPGDRPTFQWICAAVKRLIEDQKVNENEMSKTILKTKRKFNRL